MTAPLTEGGIALCALCSDARELRVAEPGADLAIVEDGGGIVAVGLPVQTSFQLANAGPLSANHPNVTVTLDGAANLESASLASGAGTWTTTTVWVPETLPQSSGNSGLWIDCFR